MNVELVGRVGEDSNEISEDDDSGTDEKEPLEGRGWGHAWQEGGEDQVGGAHPRREMGS